MITPWMSSKLNLTMFFIHNRIMNKNNWFGKSEWFVYLLNLYRRDWIRSSLKISLWWLENILLTHVLIHVASSNGKSSATRIITAKYLPPIDRDNSFDAMGCSNEPNLRDTFRILYEFGCKRPKQAPFIFLTELASSWSAWLHTYERVTGIIA